MLYYPRLTRPTWLISLGGHKLMCVNVISASCSFAGGGIPAAFFAGRMRAPIRPSTLGPDCKECYKMVHPGPLQFVK